MDLSAPAPSGRQAPQPIEAVTENVTNSNTNPSAVAVTITGCGGGGLNLARQFFGSKKLGAVKYFDTSMANSRPGESVFIVTNGSGSGSNRAENARDIERVIPQISDEDIGKSDVAIVMFSLAGGSGSTIGPLMIREYARRGVRVIGVAIADTSYSVGAKNTLNTLKTLTAVAKNNDIYLPMIILSNDQANSRGEVDDSAKHLVADLINLLTMPVYEVDRNDRLNWINPMKVVQTTPGIKLMTFSSTDSKVNEKLVLGTGSSEMVDATLILQSNANETGDELQLPSRLKKTGFYTEAHKRIVGRVSSDISSIESIIEYVDKMQNLEKAQSHVELSRLSSNGSSDMIL